MIKLKATKETCVRSDHVAEQQVPYKQAHRYMSALGLRNQTRNNTSRL